jgi:hypothetical protein
MLTKLTITVVAALALLASPVLAGPNSNSAPAQSSADFQLQGR